ncbi:RepB family plasmid replication initiator protein [Ornithobacterium rhinotracheale]|uniref:replication initiation protein n=1 Tax=Ornithobacterium rhinotracheale TaxID=28251 RepID=UPI00129C2613|nr:replication initiation protein [Ornithobacterium rhinotracheale]MRI64591.1 RepB family plasmid replication initiator protein [Ornithobacterium rhinotracheale]
MKINNKDLIQSYVITTARYDFNVNEKRVLYRIIEHLQKYTTGLKLNEKYLINKDLFGDYLFQMDLNTFLIDNANHYDRVKDAFLRLNDKKFEFQDDDSWSIIRIIESPEIVGLSTQGNSIVRFRLHKRIFDAFLDFSKGYRKYEIKVAMEFKSEYSMRFYELFSGKKEPIIYDIEELKKMFKIDGKYQKSSDFIKRVIDTAQKELTEKAPYSFKYETIKTGRRFTHIKFKPFSIPKNRDESLETKDLDKQISLRWDFSKEHLRVLKDYFNFEEKGIKNNKEILLKATRSPEFMDWCQDINGMVRKFGIGNPAGFFIAEMKKKFKN